MERRIAHEDILSKKTRNRRLQEPRCLGSGQYAPLMDQIVDRIVQEPDLKVSKGACRLDYMQKITDTLYIQKDAVITYATITNDMCGNYGVFLKFAEQKDRLTVSRSAAIEVLFPKLRHIASRIGLKRLTDTLYIGENVPIRVIHTTNGYVRVSLGNGETLDGWPTAVDLEDANAMAQEIALGMS